MKGITHPGKVIKAICYTCKEVVAATFDYGTVVFEDVPVDGVMRATCNICGSTVATAQQSAPVIRAALDMHTAKKVRTKQTTVRIPRVLADYARLKLFNHNAPDPGRFDLLLRAFVATLVGASENAAARPCGACCPRRTLYSICRATIKCRFTSAMALAPCLKNCA